MTPEADLRRQLDEARRQHMASAAEVDRMRIVAETARRRQIEFLAFVAHELRNPLASIRTASAVLGRGRQQDIDGMRSIIERQVGQMSRMIDDLVDASRASTGKLRLMRGQMRIDELVAGAVESVAPALAARNQCLEILGADGAADFDGDLARLIQVLSNVLDNASKYSPDGQAIQLTVRPTTTSVELEVVDNGIGMSAESLKNVFEPFVQELHAVRFNATGLGIGLAVVRDVVEAHEGTVVATSDGLGHGSRFVITLPRTGDTSSPRV